MPDAELNSPAAQARAKQQGGPSRLAGMATLWLLAAMMVFPPLFRAAQPALPLLALQLLALAVFVIALWTPRALPLRRPEVLTLALLFFLPLLYLIPLPAVVAEWLPGRDLYRSALATIDQGLTSYAAALSVYPQETESAWLLLLVPIAAYLGTRSLDSDRALKLVLVLIGVAAFQAAFGLMQFGQGEDSALYLGMTHTHFGSAVGTYTNRNHLAGLLEMVLPIVLALLIYSVGRRPDRTSRNWRERVNFFSSIQGHKAFLYGSLALLLLLGIVFSRSRTGIALTMLGVLLTTLVFARRVGGENVYGTAGSLVTFVVGVGIVIGLAPVLDRFSAAQAMEDMRWTMFSSTLDGIGVFFPLGSGPGNYPDVFPAFQPPLLGRWFVNHAHNDYLEWLFEGGVLVAVVGLLMLGLYARQWHRLWTKEQWSRFRFVQVAAGIGILLMLLHSFLDYNLHIPANILYFAILAGVFFTDPGTDASPRHGRHRERRTRRLEEPEQAAPAPVGFTPAKPAPDQIRNPFLD